MVDNHDDAAIQAAKAESKAAALRGLLSGKQPGVVTSEAEQSGTETITLMDQVALHAKQELEKRQSDEKSDKKLKREILEEEIATLVTEDMRHLDLYPEREKDWDAVLSYIVDNVYAKSDGIKTIDFPYADKDELFYPQPYFCVSTPAKLRFMADLIENNTAWRNRPEVPGRKTRYTMAEINDILMRMLSWSFKIKANASNITPTYFSDGKQLKIPKADAWYRILKGLDEETKHITVSHSVIVNDVRSIHVDSYRRLLSQYSVQDLADHYHLDVYLLVSVLNFKHPSFKYMFNAMDAEIWQYAHEYSIKKACEKYKCSYGKVRRIQEQYERYRLIQDEIASYVRAASSMGLLYTFKVKYADKYVEEEYQ